MSDSIPILELRDIVTLYGGQRRFLRAPKPPVRAVNGVSLVLYQGEILGLVGESGCGKTTLGRTILGIQREAEGEIYLDGKPVHGLPPREARQTRLDIQYVHQDPGAALDPWWSIGRSLHEGLVINGVKSFAEREEKIDRVLDAVGLGPDFKRRYPHELSGGQLRRIGLARILVLSPRIVVLDEPTSGLDLSVQATVLLLFRELRERLGLTYVFISHDLSVVHRMCDRVAIMYLGKVVEIAGKDQIYNRPIHPYTRALLSAAPRLQPGQVMDDSLISGEPPSPTAVPSGCAYRTRCPYAEATCAEQVPPMQSAADGHQVACLRWRDLPDHVPADAHTDSQPRGAASAGGT